MRIKKALSSLLALSIFISNMDIYSSSSTGLYNRYQTLEGEYISIDKSTEGELHEIEIFGNTAQHTDDLKDIQSVGDLYVDEYGNPILDNQGREQYEINISTTGKNIFSVERMLESFNDRISLDDDGFLILDKTNFSFYEIPSYTYDPEKIYTFSAITNKNEDGIGDCIALEFYYTDGTYNQVYIGAWGTSTHSQQGKTIEKILIRYPWAHLGHIAKIKDIQLEEGLSPTSYENYTENKITILLPTQLQRIEGVSDKLYWDSSKSRYIIEKKIKSIVLDGTEVWTNTNRDLEDTMYF